jgi:hypothetical protein
MRSISEFPLTRHPLEIAILIWEIAKPDIHLGRIRIANQPAALRIFIEFGESDASCSTAFAAYSIFKERSLRIKLIFSGLMNA